MTVKDIFENLSYGDAPEDAKPAFEWLDGFERKFGHYVGGEWVQGEEHFESVNPATTGFLAHIAQGSEGLVNQAVDAARKALPAWQALGPLGRSKVLYALARGIQRHSRLFAVLETLDNGKPIRETRDLDIPLVARHFYHHAGWARLVDTEFSGYESVGVCGQIIPWNFPLLMLSWKIAPALAAGNTVVLKPAEFTSLTALLFADLCDKVGVPPGVVNIVTGDGRTGAAIVNHADVDKVAFTGSTEVGRILRTATAGTGKKLSLELGGKSPYIVFEDADLDSAVEGLVDAIWFNQGQVCCAGSRLLVQEGIAEKAYAKIRARMQNLRLGSPLDKAVDIGAVVDKTQLDRITELVEVGVSEGATKFQAGTCPTEGWFYPPTLLTDVAPSSTVAQVEIFGPVLVGMTFRTPDEAVALANNTVFGLASSVWTENLNVAHDIASRIKAGTVWINCTNQFDGAVGFGGYRESGFGREGGKEGMYEYLKAKIAKGAEPGDTKSVPASSPSEGVDRSHKLYIGGKQARPDGGYSQSYNTVHGPIDVAIGNRKDVRNAIEASESALSSWGGATAHLRAQVLYYLGENIDAERESFVKALTAFGMSDADAEAEIDASIDRCFYYAAWADKYDGQVHGAPLRAVVYTRNEAIGSAGVVAPRESALLGLLSSTLPLLAMGNTVTVVPSDMNPLPACELYRVLEASDFPGGSFNILTGDQKELASVLANHDTVQVLWSFLGAESAEGLEKASVGNLKQTWCPMHKIAWFEAPHPEFLRRAVQVKNIWTPFGS